MTQVTDTDTAVRASITVEVPQKRAFEVFTTGMSSWWPLDTHHIGDADAAEAVVEPFVGGRYFERGVDGSECDWGRVAAWEPPDRLVLLWMLSREWGFDPDESHATEVEVLFVAESPTRTRVELSHSGFERMPHGDEIRASVASDGGWRGLLDLFAKAV
jgi:uncharacterized protein YndB with AHSA1/START domain